MSGPFNHPELLLNLSYPISSRAPASAPTTTTASTEQKDPFTDLAGFFFFFVGMEMNTKGIHKLCTYFCTVTSLQVVCLYGNEYTCYKAYPLYTTLYGR